MPEFTYPNSVYDRPRNLLALLGGWWARDYAGSHQVLGLMESKALVEQQTVLDTLDLLASLSRFTVPIYHRSNWYAYYIKESERNDAQTSLLKYDGSKNYDEGDLYDVPTATPWSSFPKPDKLVDANLIVNRFADPSLVLHRGINFVIEDDAVVFLHDPFDDVRVAKRPVYQSGEIVDREALLWIFHGDFDFETAYEQFGYVLGLRLASSTGYRTLMNAVWDAMIGGATKQSIYQAFSAMTGVPLVREDEETVETVDSDANNRLIITDQHVYKFHLDAAPLVAAGDTVRRGQMMTDTLQVFEFNRGQLDDSIKSLSIGGGFLATCFYSDLVFENKDVALSVITDDPSGFTRLEWDLGGFPLDVEQFFDELHARGVAAALEPIDDCDDSETVRYPANDCDESDQYVRRGTLAHLLDTRAAKIGEPKAANLPATINPLKFLVENVLRNNVFLVRVRINTMGPDSVGLFNTRLLQRVVPPHTAMLLLMELTAARDSVTVNLINERISTYTGMEPLEDVVAKTAVNESRVTLRVVSGTCQ